MSVISLAFPELDDVPEIFAFGRKEIAFLYLQRDTHMFQTCQPIVDVVHMVINSVLEDDYIFEVDEACFSLMFNDYDVKSLLKKTQERFLRRKRRKYIGRFYSE